MAVDSDHAEATLFGVPQAELTHDAIRSDYGRGGSLWRGFRLFETGANGED